MNNLVFNTTASQLLVTVANTSLTISGSVTIGANAFTSSTVSGTNVTGTGILFADTDISTIKTASMFVYNEGAQTVTLSLQFSPDTTPTHYITDPNYSAVTLTGTSGQLFIDISKFAHYVQLAYNTSATATFSAVYDAQA